MQIGDLKSEIDALNDSVQTLTETGGTLTTDGTEQSLYISNTPAGVFSPRSIFVDFTAHTVGETVEIKEYYRIKSGGNLILHLSTSYAGLVSPELVEHKLSDNRYGVRVTLEKTAGANRAYDWEVNYAI